MVKIPLSNLNYSFLKKPLLVGGMAMEYYGLRKSGKDIDLIVVEEDLVNLIKLYPDRVKDLWGDLGVCPFNFEIWRSICYFDYDDLKEGAIEEENILVISMEKLFLMKAYDLKEGKYLDDARLISAAMQKKKSEKYKEVKSRNEKLLQSIEKVNYIKKQVLKKLE